MVFEYSITSNRRERVFSQFSKVKSKPVPPPRKRSKEKEDKVNDNGDDGLEMKHLVAIVEEDKGKYYFDNHSNIVVISPAYCYCILLLQ